MELIMCLFPKIQKVKYRNVKYHFTSDSIFVNCNHCEECLKAKRSDYQVRTYFEFLSTVKKGGFVFCDTLTYSPEWKPMKYFHEKKTALLPYHDYEDIQKFLKRLRRNIQKHQCKKYGFKLTSDEGIKLQKSVSSRLKYFMVCEFGKEYPNFHPHYHFTFFVTIPRFTSYELKDLINLSWRGTKDIKPNRNFFSYGEFDKGATDLNTKQQIDYMTLNDPSNLRAIGYLTKYMTKDSVAENYFRYKLGLDQKDELPTELYCRWKSSCNLGFDVFKNLNDYLPFLESHNSLVDLEKGIISIPNDLESDSFYTCDIPYYYFKKLYFLNKKTNDGTYISVPRDNYEYNCNLPSLEVAKKQRFVKDLDRIVNRYNKIYAQFPDDVQELVDTLMSGRDFYDLAYFKKLCYGRFWTKPYLELLNTGCPDDLLDVLYSPDTQFVQFDDFESAQDFCSERRIRTLDYYQSKFPSFVYLVELFECRCQSANISKNLQYELKRRNLNLLRYAERF